jgi:hypothetical protein
MEIDHSFPPFSDLNFLNIRIVLGNTMKTHPILGLRLWNWNWKKFDMLASKRNHGSE